MERILSGTLGFFYRKIVAQGKNINKKTVKDKIKIKIGRQHSIRSKKHAVFRGSPLIFRGLAPFL
jgi:hypothetical protein